MSTGPVAAAIRAHTPPSSPSHGSPAAKKVKLDSDVQEEAALASSSVAAPTAAAGAGTPAVAKGKKAAPPRNAPPPGPRKVIKPAANGPRRVKRKPVDEVVLNEIKVFLGPEAVSAANAAQLDWEAPAGCERDQVVVVRTGDGMTAGGNALALYSSPADSPGGSRPWVLSIPFGLPGELVRVRIDAGSRLHSTAELLEVVEPNKTLRLAEGEGVGCKYFGKCGGCQFQHVSYETQLVLKRETVRKAFRYFSKLDASLIPEIGETIPSPKQAGYRTKITPHFRPLPTPIRTDVMEKAGLPLAPRKGTNPYAKAHAASSRVPSPTSTPLGTSGRTTPAVDVDDEEAGLNGDPLKTVGGTIDATEDNDGGADNAEAPSLIAGLSGGIDGSRFFARVGEQAATGGAHEFFIGFDEKISKRLMDIEECPLATPIINARYAIERKKITQIAASYAKDASLLLRDSAHPESFPPGNTVPEGTQVCITDHRETVHERVGDLHFVFPAGSFFQNNNSILPSLTNYVRQAIFEPPATAVVQTLPTHLVDTYCGSGLFAITLSPFFERVTGIEIDPKSIDFAKRNAKLNGVEGQCEFKAGKSEEIFGTVTGLPWDKTAVVIDPPRKGCDEGFLGQLVAVAPQTLVYVSCNVHTQARDVGFLLRQDVGGKRYVLESLRGFDLFPQTAHVEGVAVLRLQTLPLKDDL